MASRKLGGGRVLGSGRSLSPAVAPKRNSSLLSPSESSVSLNSQVSTSQVSSENQDISSRISLENGESATAAEVAAASSRLVCPICNEEMVTLLQLNRHLDDDHKNLEEVKQDEVKDWFKTQMVKAKKFQPLAVLNQKLKGLEVFEANDVPLSAALPPSGHSAPEAPRPDPDEFVTRAHWQRHGVNDVCSEPLCGKRLTASNGNVNSLARDHTEDFRITRRRTVDKTYLEVSRLEKRLTKLTQLLTSPLPEQMAGNSGLLWPLSGVKNQRKLLEQSVVTWEDDATVSRCPFCQQEFSSYSFRRHHCRLCGRVVCGDSQTGCSSEIGLNVAAKKAVGEISLDIRMCKECKNTIFSRRDFASELAMKPPDLKAYENLVEFERGIRLLMPKFQRLLVALQDPDRSPSPAQLADASKVRKRLMDSFAQYDVAARRIRDLPTSSPTQQKLQKAIYQQATSFLHLYMLPLKTLPKILKHASPHGNTSTGHLTPHGRPSGALTSIKYNDVDASSQASSSSAVSALEAEEKTIRERLIVLEEQKFFVSEMIADANKRRKFDEVSSLAQNVADLSKEIDQVNGMLEQLDFAGTYASQGLEMPPVR
ncbi:MAG: carboxypeptidase Y-deficient [Pleopsidium flavum]|nr:MAG: carboxypeptidase Y-deficient [Pleopsidium flavum]